MWNYADVGIAVKHEAWLALQIKDVWYKAGGVATSDGRNHFLPRAWRAASSGDRAESRVELPKAFVVVLMIPPVSQGRRSKSYSYLSSSISRPKLAIVSPPEEVFWIQ